MNADNLKDTTEGSNLSAGQIRQVATDRDSSRRVLQSGASSSGGIQMKNGLAIADSSTDTDVFVKNDTGADITLGTPVYLNIPDTSLTNQLDPYTGQWIYRAIVPTGYNLRPIYGIMLNDCKNGAIAKARIRGVAYIDPFTSGFPFWNAGALTYISPTTVESYLFGIRLLGGAIYLDQTGSIPIGFSFSDTYTYSLSESNSFAYSGIALPASKLKIPATGRYEFDVSLQLNVSQVSINNELILNASSLSNIAYYLPIEFGCQLKKLDSSCNPGSILWPQSTNTPSFGTPTNHAGILKLPCWRISKYDGSVYSYAMDRAAGGTAYGNFIATVNAGENLLFGLNLFGLGAGSTVGKSGPDFPTVSITVKYSGHITGRAIPIFTTQATSC